MDLQLNEFDSPLGIVLVATDDAAVRAVDFADYRDRMDRLLNRHYGQYVLRAGRDRVGAVTRLKAYFAGDLSAIDSLSVATNGTPFQQRVWTALRSIPSGKTISYGTLAKNIKQPTAGRAVGLANGSNPIAIIVPCHRVIGANKTLTGYGGGLHRKEWLLHHEINHQAE